MDYSNWPTTDRFGLAREPLIALFDGVIAGAS